MKEFERALRDYALPLAGIPSVIRQSAIQENNLQANNFEIKPITLQLIQNIRFMRLPNEDPNTYISNFLEVCDTMNYNGVSDDAIRPFPIFIKRQGETLAKFRASRLHHYLG